MPPTKSPVEQNVYGVRVEKIPYQEVQHLEIDQEKIAIELLEETMRDLLN